jgi:hypothetical protein
MVACTPWYGSSHSTVLPLRPIRQSDHRRGRAAIKGAFALDFLFLTGLSKLTRLAPDEHLKQKFRFWFRICQICHFFSAFQIFLFYVQICSLIFQYTNQVPSMYLSKRTSSLHVSSVSEQIHSVYSQYMNRFIPCIYQISITKFA